MKKRILSQRIPEWMSSASCAKKPGDLWYADQPRFQADAKEICSRCPVLAACLRWAIDTDERDGIWGGHTPKERANLLRRVDYQLRKVPA
jgi:WhiB family redox-sensing transcriptional regulator